MAAELFKIACVTCNARLSVRNASAIGQILSCPRCGSMVQVTPPASFTAASVESTEAAVAANVPPVEAPPSEVTDAASNESFDDVPDKSAPPEDTATASEEIGADAAAPATGVDQAVAQTSLYQLIAYGVAALTVGAIVMGIFLYLSGRGNAPVAKTASGDLATAETEQESKLPPSQVDPKTPEKKIEVPDSGPLETVAPLEVAQAEAAEPNLPENEAPLSDDPDEPTATPEIEFPPKSATADAQPTAAATEDSSKAKIRIDPLDLDPESLDMNAITVGEPPAHPSVSESIENAPPEDRLATRLPKEQPPAGQNPVAPLPVRLAAEQPAAPANASELLAVEFPAIAIEAMPLCDFLNFTTRLGATPVSVSPGELILAGVSATQAVSIDAADVSFEDLLSQALKPLRLEAEVIANQVVLRRSGLRGEREIEYPIDDLLDANTTAQSLAELIERFVAPKDWAKQGGSGIIELTDNKKLWIAQSERIQYEVLRFFENFRLARNLKPRSSYPAALLSATSPYVQLQDALASRTTFTISNFTPLSEVFRHWRNELGLAVLVDWPALAEVKLYPQSQIACNAANQPWHTALDNVLTPLGLAWRAIDGRTLEITSEAVAIQSRQVEFYSLATKPGLELATVEQQLSNFRGKPAADGAAVAIDAASRTLIVRDSAMVHRQLASWLSEQAR